MDILDSLLNSQQLDIDCPHCHCRRAQSLARLRMEAQLNCPACGERLEVDASAFEQSVRGMKEHFVQVLDTGPSAIKLRVLMA